MCDLICVDLVDTLLFSFQTYNRADCYGQPDAVIMGKFTTKISFFVKGVVRELKSRGVIYKSRDTAVKT